MSISPFPVPYDGHLLFILDHLAVDSKSRNKVQMSVSGGMKKSKDSIG